MATTAIVAIRDHWENFHAIYNYYEPLKLKWLVLEQGMKSGADLPKDVSHHLIRDPAMFNRGRLFNFGRDMTDGQVMYVDPDVFMDREMLQDCLLSDKEWILPRTYLVNHSYERSIGIREAMGQNKLGTLPTIGPDDRKYIWPVCGGLSITRSRMRWPEFEGWGHEDRVMDAYIMAKSTSVLMKVAPLHHLWHDRDMNLQKECEVVNRARANEILDRLPN
jgi:hypothetical protein